MAQDPAYLWKKLDNAATLSTATSPEKKKEKVGSKDDSGWKRRRWLVLDIICAGLWFFTILQLLFGDVPLKIAGRLSPVAVDLVNFRGALFLVAVSAVVVVYRRWSAFIFAYIFLFPFIVLFVKIPILIYVKRSWILFMFVLQLLTVVVHRAGHSIVGFTAWVLASMFVLTAAHDVFTIAGGLAAAALLMMALMRTVLNAVRPSLFLTVQSNLVRQGVQLGEEKRIWRLDEGLRSHKIRKYTPAQTDVFLSKATYALLVSRATAVLAFRLDQYRRSPASIIGSCLAIVWLVLQTTWALAIINCAIFKVDPGQFSFDTPPSLVTFLYYSFSSLTGNEIQALVPISDLSEGVKLASGILGVIVILTVVAALAFNFRQSRQSDDSLEIVTDLKAEYRRLSTQIVSDFGVNAKEAEKRLQAAGHGLVGVAAFLAAQLPDGFLDD